MSSNNVAVSVRGLSKSYSIAHNSAKHTTLGEMLAHRLKHPLARPQKETFWALKDVDFEIQKGDVVGIIGRNGAGKSTLLKVLSRITKPTVGQIDLFGRVGSLLEVGTGFHPELTGRENIFLNGAILGMRKREIERQFDAIVEFAEVNRFLDTPVKRYSSGMYVRLAFAVAAHLNPEILIVDEVLAVGDASFQAKCLNKMSEVSTQEGRTVIFVSHNMAAVQKLCLRGIMMSGGQVAFNGDADQAVAHYIASLHQSDLLQAPGEFNLALRPGETLIKRLQILNGEGMPVAAVGMGEPLSLVIDVEGFNEVPNSSLGVRFKADDETIIASFATSMMGARALDPRTRRERITFKLPQVPFTPGTIWVELIAKESGQAQRRDYIERAGSFDVEPVDVYGTGYKFPFNDGRIFLQGQWEIQDNEQSSQTALSEANL